MACMVGGPGLVGGVLLGQNLEGIVRMTCEYFTFDLRCDQVGCPLLQEPRMDYQALLLPPFVTCLGGVTRAIHMYITLVWRLDLTSSCGVIPLATLEAVLGGRGFLPPSCCGGGVYVGFTVGDRSSHTMLRFTISFLLIPPTFFLLRG